MKSDIQPIWLKHTPLSTEKKRKQKIDIFIPLILIVIQPPLRQERNISQLKLDGRQNDMIDFMII